MMKMFKFDGEEVKVNSNTIGVNITELRSALNAAKKNAGYREMDIINNLVSIDIKSHVYPGDRYWTADAYNEEGNGFEFIIRHETDHKNGYKPGDIVG